MMLKDFGLDLKLLREAKGITIAEISAQTRINPKFFMNIEAGVFDFQPETYMRAFIKEYARSLDLDENKILNEYDKAKGGFYAKRSILKGITNYQEPEVTVPKPAEPEKLIITATPKDEDDLDLQQQKKTETQLVEHHYKPSDFKDEPEPEFSNKTWTQKILLIILIAGLAALIVYMINYLNKDGDNTNVKPKSFNEMSADYENKLKGNVQDTVKTDSLKTAANDSLKLSVVAGKDIRIKIYLDENKVVEGEIPAKDTLNVKAKEQFRFSSSANQSVDLYLNGKYLKKPTSLSGLSIKNLVINKNGIVTQP